ncbi:hypothetical protein WG947_09090 [Pontibacter sp. H259]|uniref:hypothetical protein n=1 Tax=Pontibacter sp. H259 TaxID=3133421 RepID=UPI0030C227E2
MKKTFMMLLALCFVLAGQSVIAQKKAYEQGDYIANLGVSLGYYGYGFVGSRSGGFIPVTASIEKGFHEYISAGPYVGYASWKYKGPNYNYSWNFTSVGARGTFHAVPLLNESLSTTINEEKFDLYATLIAGLEFRSFSGDNDIEDYANETNFFIGPVLGAKYKFNDRFGVYFEGGRGAFGYGTLGVSANF